MPWHRYEVWDWVEAVGEGVTEPWIVSVHGVAKCATEDEPYIVANEFVAASLARALWLPCPPGFWTERDGHPCYVSLKFTIGGHDLPPVVPDLLVEDHPRLATGIILFDAWITNTDRHAANLAVRGDEVHVFDHSHALLGPGDGIQRLRDEAESIGIYGHCLAPELRRFAKAEEWYDRIRSVPEHYIRETVQAAAGMGLPELLPESSS